MSNLNDFVIENDVLTKYVGPGGDVVVPEGVTSIGTEAFGNCADLTSVILPNSLTSIDNSAFFNCSGLLSISLPAGLETIGAHAFGNCASLASFAIPNKAVSIGPCAFLGCKQLADADGFVIVDDILFDYFGVGGDVIIPAGVKVLSDFSFRRCNLLQREHVEMDSVVLPTSLTKIGPAVFEHCERLREVKIPNRVTDIGDCAFQLNRWLSKVTLPKNLVNLESYAFAGCAIERLSLPKGLKKIGEGALMNNNLQKLVMPDQVEIIEKRAFIGQLYAFFTLIVTPGTMTEKAVKQYVKKDKCNVDYQAKK